MKILFLSLFIFYFADCGSTKTADPCYSDRSVIESIVDIDLKCVSTGEQSLFLNESSNVRYSVCNAATYTFEEGRTYKVSGKVYEVKPNERWPGTPFEISNIKN